MRYISFKSAVFLSASLHRLVFGQDETEQTPDRAAYETGVPIDQLLFGQVEMNQAPDVAAAYQLGVTTDQRVFGDGETKQAPDAAAYEIGVPDGDLQNPDASSNTSDTLGTSGIWESIVSTSWTKHSRAASEYTEDGTVLKVLRNEEKVKMSVIKICGGLFYARSIFWKGGFTGQHLHQDNYFNQAQFFAGLTQASADADDAYVVREKPIKIMTDRTSSACSVTTSWKDNGNWGKLGDIIDHFIEIWRAPKDTCSISPSHGGGNGLQCALPCDPIGPMWLQSTNLYLRKVGVTVIGRGRVYSVVYKLRGQFNRGEGNGGLVPPRWLNAQCDGDNLYFKETPDDPTYVVFW